MAEATFPDGFERWIKTVTDVPNPDPAFLASLRNRFLTREHNHSVAAGFSAGEPEFPISSVNPQKDLERTRYPRRISRSLAWGLGLILVILGIVLLVSSPYAVRALKRLFGFIPGVGLVEEGFPIRVLEGPVTLTRENIRLTVEQAVADSARTIVIYQYPPPEVDDNAAPSGTAFLKGPALRLPDGTEMAVKYGYHLDSEDCNCIRYALEFNPLPAAITDVILILPQLAGMPSGAGPLNWEIPLHLMPAPEGFVLPVMELNTPGISTALPSMITPSLSAEQGSYGIRLNVEKMVPLEDGYILSGDVTWSGKDFPAYAVRIDEDSFQITDAGGRNVSFEPVYAPSEPSDVPEYATPWMIKIKSKDFDSPLTLRIDQVQTEIFPISITIDLGSDPRIGQSWTLNRDVLIAGSTARILSAQLIDSGDGWLQFQFDVQVDPMVVGDLTVILPSVECGGGGGLPQEHLSRIQVFMNTCRKNLPSGPLEIQMVSAVLWGSWQVAWSP
jgi:hypothetical protein